MSLPSLNQFINLVNRSPGGITPSQDNLLLISSTIEELKQAEESLYKGYELNRVIDDVNKNGYSISLFSFDTSQVGNLESTPLSYAVVTGTPDPDTQDYTIVAGDDPSRQEEWVSFFGFSPDIKNLSRYSSSLVEYNKNNSNYPFQESGTVDVWIYYPKGAQPIVNGQTYSFAEGLLNLADYP